MKYLVIKVKLSQFGTMYSEAQSNLWANKLLEALSNDAGISQPTKNICAKLKHQQNPWQDELKARWRRIKYPLYD